MTIRGGFRRIAHVAAWLLATVVLAAPAFGQSDDEPPQLEPYRVRVSVAFERDPLLTQAVRQALLDRIERLAERTFGQMWQPTVLENRWLPQADKSNLSRLGATVAPKRFPAEEYDKAFVTVIGFSGSRAEVTGREWDAASRTWSAIATRETADRRAVPHAAVSLMQRLFRPTLDISRVDGQQVELMLHAGEFPPSSPQAAQVQPGDLIRPFLRYRDRDGAVQRIQFVPWTYLLVQNVDRARITCSLISGIRAPLGTGRARLVEFMGLRVRPREHTSRLRVVTGTDSSRPLAGREVTVIPKTQPDQEAQSPPQRLMTDRLGSVPVTASAEQPLVWVYVHSGETLRARVPFVPGISETGTLELTDDSVRLSVRGELELLHARLIDAVARRGTLMAAARRAARAGEWEKVDDRMARLDDAPGRETFTDRLRVIRAQAINRARERNDRVAEAEVNRLCDKTRGLIREYFDPARVNTLEAEIDDLRQLDEPSTTGTD